MISVMARTTAGNYHFHDADCKLLGRDFCFSGLVSLCQHIFFEVTESFCS